MRQGHNNKDRAFLRRQDQAVWQKKKYRCSCNLTIIKVDDDRVCGGITVTPLKSLLRRHMLPLNCQIKDILKKMTKLEVQLIPHLPMKTKGERYGGVPGSLFVLHPSSGYCSAKLGVSPAPSITAFQSIADKAETRPLGQGGECSHALPASPSPAPLQTELRQLVWPLRVGQDLRAPAQQQQLPAHFSQLPPPLELYNLCIRAAIYCRLPCIPSQRWTHHHSFFFVKSFTQAFLFLLHWQIRAKLS